jgi:hypothetical protein
VHSVDAADSERRSKSAELIHAPRLLG